MSSKAAMRRRARAQRRAETERTADWTCACGERIKYAYVLCPWCRAVRPGASSHAATSPERAARDQPDGEHGGPTRRAATAQGHRPG
jgi:hypothetical protein